MKISVIIPAYNNLAAVLTCLNSLQATQAPGTTVEYIVADDASPDVFYPMLIPPSIATVTRADVNGGFAANCNRGAQAASGDVLFFVNQDVSAAPFGLSMGWNARLSDLFEASTAGIIAPLLLFPDGKVQSCGGAFDTLAQPVHRGLGWSDLTHPMIAKWDSIPWATGAALAFRRACWEAIGGFDTSFKMYFEDVDACLRARVCGYLMMYTPDVKLVHSVGSTGGSPHFAASARLWKSRWVDSGKVKAGSLMATQRFW